MKTHAGLLSFTDAITLVADKGQQDSLRFCRQTECLALLKARGRILAEDLCSPESIPAFDNSQMDGFLLESSRLIYASPEHPVILPLRGSLAAGDPSVALTTGGAYEIMTGAGIPDGTYDCVLKVEDAEWKETAEGRCLLVRQSLEAGHYVRPKAADFQKGQLIARAGQLITPELIMSC